jgi:hypothetical protein
MALVLTPEQKKRLIGRLGKLAQALVSGAGRTDSGEPQDPNMGNLPPGPAKNNHSKPCGGCDVNKGKK